MQRLIAFKYACKISHWRTDNYALHLLFDRLQEDLDELIDEVAEHYFMAFDHKRELTQDVLRPDYVNKDLAAGIREMINLLEKMAKSGEYTEGVNSLLTGLADNFEGKLALAAMG
jgi:DNA-binding ferritin-like protein